MGTYIGINLTEKTKSDITKFCYDQNILIKVNDFDQSLHSTIVYSYDKTEITLDNILNFINKDKKISKDCGNIIGFELLWNQTTQDYSCLGAKLESNYLMYLNEKLQKEFNIKHLFDEYIPHITFSYNFKGKIKNLPLPKFNIDFLDLYVKELILPNNSTTTKKIIHHG